MVTGSRYRQQALRLLAWLAMKSLLRRFALEGLARAGFFDAVAKARQKIARYTAERRRQEPSLLLGSGDRQRRPGELTKEALYLADYGRGWGQRLTYSVGISYIAGMAVGGAWGFVSGVRKGGETPKLFLNSVLNGCVTNGPPVGNQAATMTMYYVTVKSGMSLLSKGRAAAIATPLSGALAGALYKSSRGGAESMRHAALGAGAFAVSEKLRGQWD